MIATRNGLIATYRDYEVGLPHPLCIPLGHVANAAEGRINLTGHPSTPFWREAVRETLPAHRQVALHRMVLDALVKAGAHDNLHARFAHHAEEAAMEPLFSNRHPRRRDTRRSLAPIVEAAGQYARALRRSRVLDARQGALLLRGRSRECYRSIRRLAALLQSPDRHSDGHEVRPQSK